MNYIFSFFNDIILTHGVAWLIGQIFGIIAIILGFISYQLKTQKQLLFMQTSVAAAFCVHYFLIGAYSGMAMNAVGIIRNAVYNRQNQKGASNKLIPFAFVAVQCVIWALTWEAWYSVFVLLGLTINTYCMSFKNPQNVRKSIFVTSPLVLTYDVFASSYGGMIYESVAIISSFIGVMRNRRKSEQ